ncbi:OmpA family protein [Kangiella marina]|uniref:OmpA family protein n=1 Tax=Kangiella marina TaxID=1079178 RepID=A0ABP8IIC4_9GAMM
MKKKLIAAACMLALSSTAFANEGEVKDRHGFYGYVGWGGIELDPARTAERGQGGNFGLGWAFNKSWSVEGNYNYFNDIDNNSNGLTGDLQTYSVDFLYNDVSWIGSESTHPFLKFGYGKTEEKYDVWNDTIENDEFYKVGLGFQHFATDKVFMRIGYDFLDSGETGDDNLWYFNIGYFFGETVRTAAAPKPVEPKKEAKDSDGDGVIDANDRCPGTPAGAAVDAYGCALDSDGDGVADYKDACPGTEAGAKVDEKGCKIEPKEDVVVDMRLNFDVDKYQIKPEMVSEIAKVAEFLRQYPGVNAQIQGHTDSTGSNQYNQGLSERRAGAVKDYLINNFGIDGSRLTSIGYGEERPIADNSTADGRALNRRVEANAETKK